YLRTSRWCRLSVALFVSIVTGPIGCCGAIPTSAPAGAGFVALSTSPSFGDIAELATAGAAAAMPTLITAIRGAFNGPPHVVVSGRPLSLVQRSPVSHLLWGVPAN